MKSILMLTAVCSFSMLAMQDLGTQFEAKSAARINNYQRASFLSKCATTPFQIINDVPKVFGLWVTFGIALHPASMYKRDCIGRGASPRALALELAAGTLAFSSLLECGTKSLLHAFGMPTIKEITSYNKFMNQRKQAGLPALPTVNA